MICVMDGAFIFAADLARELKSDVTFEFIKASSYGNHHESSRSVALENPERLRGSLFTQDVLIVEDICDTGHTLSLIQRAVQGRSPKSLRTAVLLNKQSRREVPVQLDYIGFEIPNVFVAGYGLDDAGKYRNLPDICTM